MILREDAIKGPFQLMATFEISSISSVFLVYLV